MDGEYCFGTPVFRAKPSKPKLCLQVEDKDCAKQTEAEGGQV